jgi:hypothetical protein
MKYKLIVCSLTLQNQSDALSTGALSLFATLVMLLATTQVNILCIKCKVHVTYTNLFNCIF